ncbi:hypothetical protein RIR_jg23487.t1 [Rhizophagus irregularis DAOM 181602=DAOM 197198]|nr:hypothetical protein RIR_jg23487.t1 [Rhizophagus irregularis DAOM 181602=DAOM 197198]
MLCTILTTDHTDHQFIPSIIPGIHTSARIYRVEYLGFLDEIKEKHFKRQIEIYCLSLKSIIGQGKLNQRHGKAQLLLDQYKKGKKPDYKEARKWRKEKEKSRNKYQKNLRKERKVRKMKKKMKELMTQQYFMIN